MADGHSSGCRTCGKPTKVFVSSGRSAAYCSAECRTRDKDQRRTGQKLAPCAQCGAERRGSSKRSATLCKACSARQAATLAKQAHLRRYEERHGHVSATVLGGRTGGRLFSPLYVVTCEESGEQHLAKRKRLCGCGACVSRRAADHRDQYDPLRIERRSCQSCGQPMEVIRGRGSRVSGMHPRTCQACKRLSRIAARRIAKIVRRARAKNAPVLERVDPLVVFDRAGWRCQSCGCDTPKALRGSMHDDAPELDHIVPISQGGAHAYSNVQCLCRVCNILKSDRSMPEFQKWNIGGYA